MEQTTRRLIEAVRRHRVLYDPAHEGYYRSAREKHKTWEGVAAGLGESTDVIKARWKNLRDSYGKHLRALKPGCRAKYCERYRAWPWVRHMAFLRPFLESEVDSRRRCARNAPEPEPEPEPVLLEPYREEELVDEKPVFEDAELLQPVSAEPGFPFAAEREDQPALSPGALDDTDLIFLGYSRALRRLSRQRQALAKFKIAKIMMEEELAQAREDATRQAHDPF